MIGLALAEQEAIGKALAATGGNKVRAVILLGISCKKLSNKLKKYGWA